MSRVSAVALLVLLSAAAPLTGQGRNAARGRPYTLMPRPNYRHCTEPGDKTQLTDGVTTKGYFWTQKTTVGWGRGAPAFITIDLGKVHAISGMSFGTAAGVAGVEWPAALLVFVSDDGKQWFPAGDLVELSARKTKPPTGKYATHIFRTAELRTHGRFVQLACMSTGPYLFVDEIEVFEGDAALLKQPREGKPLASVPQFMDTLQLNRLLKAQLRRDLAAVKDDIDELAPAKKAEFSERAEALDHQIADMPFVSPDGFRAVLPMTKLERDIFRLQAAVWRAQEKPPLRLWQTHRWDPLAPSADPPDDPSVPTLDVRMMSNEVRCDVVNITSALEKDREIRLRIEGLPGGTNPTYIAVHEVQHVGTRHFVAVAAALPLARREGGSWLITVQAGMTRQVWVSFHPKNVKPGVYEGRIVVDDGSPVKVAVPIRLRVYPLRFPDATTLLLGGWSYTNQERMYGATPENRDALIKMLREHHVNAPWATRAAMPTGKFDAEGNLAEKPDTSNFDAWVERWPGAKRYMVFVAVGDYGSVRSSFAGSKVGTPLFAKKLGAWIRFWAGHLRELGLKPSQLGLLLVDEPNRKEQFDVTTAWTKAIKAAEPDVVIWVDPVPRELKTCVEMLETVDVLVPNRSAWLQKDAVYHKLFLDQRAQGRQLGFYSCAGPARRFDPYSYYLLQQWHVFAIGGTWAGFWAFGDNGKVSCWNEYVAKGNGPYCPLYLDDASVTGAKYLEAIREGVQDYEYLVMLRTRIGKLEQTKRDTPLLKKARALLAGACARVLKAEGATNYGWDEPKDRTLADRVRIEILEMLTAMSGK